MKKAQYSEIFESLEKSGLSISPEDRKRIETRFKKRMNYVPKIGVFGKTGVGKSSLCNAVFGQDVCGVSDIEACTRKPQDVLLSIGGSRLKLIDIPGVGESEDREVEYEKLYSRLLPEMDVVIWVLKGDDRAFATDQKHFEGLVKPILAEKKYKKNGGFSKPFFIVLNQVDKIEPFREWDVEARQPSRKQGVNIERKRASVAKFFGLPIDRIVPVSAEEGYGLVELVDKLVFSLPKERKQILLNATQESTRSSKATKQANRGVWEGLIDAAKEILAPVGRWLIEQGVQGLLKWALNKS